MRDEVKAKAEGRTVEGGKEKISARSPKKPSTADAPSSSQSPTTTPQSPSSSSIHPSSLIPHPSLKSVTIFCDGSSLGNGQGVTRAAAAALLGYRGIWRAFGLYLGSATNQQAEVAAAALGLEALSEPCRVRLVTDSRYVVETMSGRFRRKTNLEWWARLDKAAHKHEVAWEWAKGHAGHTVQEAVDRAARRIATLGRVDESVLREAVDSVGSEE